MADTLDEKTVKRAGRRIGHAFKNRDLLVQALTHRSFANEASEEVGHNERLEFLGDAVLSLAVSAMLMKGSPEVGEGTLSRMRAALVNRRELSEVANSMELGPLLRLGRGEERSGGREKESLLADCFEAVLGAVFLDGGWRAACRVVEKALGKRMPDLTSSLPGFDPKSRLQEVFQKEGRSPPSYTLVEVSGPDHQRSFTVSVYSSGQELGRGCGPSKKEAEQAAARRVLEALADRSPGPGRPAEPR